MTRLCMGLTLHCHPERQRRILFVAGDSSSHALLRMTCSVGDGPWTSRRCRIGLLRGVEGAAPYVPRNDNEMMQIE
jgi:hypothetical protein